MRKKTPTRMCRAWAIIEDGKLMIADHRLPIYWRRNIAKQDATELSYGGSVVRVIVTKEQKRDESA